MRIVHFNDFKTTELSPGLIIPMVAYNYPAMDFPSFVSYK